MPLVIQHITNYIQVNSLSVHNPSKKPAHLSWLFVFGLINKRSSSCPDGMNNMSYLAHGSDQGNSVRFTLSFLFKEECFKHVVIKNGNRGGVVEACSKYLIASF